MDRQSIVEQAKTPRAVRGPKGFQRPGSPLDLVDAGLVENVSERPRPCENHFDKKMLLKNMHESPSARSPLLNQPYLRDSGSMCFFAYTQIGDGLPLIMKRKI